MLDSSTNSIQSWCNDSFNLHVDKHNVYGRQPFSNKSQLLRLKTTLLNNIEKKNTNILANRKGVRCKAFLNGKMTKQNHKHPTEVKTYANQSNTNLNYNSRS